MKKFTAVSLRLFVMFFALLLFSATLKGSAYAEEPEVIRGIYAGLVTVKEDYDIYIDVNAPNFKPVNDEFITTANTGMYFRSRHWGTQHKIEHEFLDQDMLFFIKQDVAHSLEFFNLPTNYVLAGIDGVAFGPKNIDHVMVSYSGGKLRMRPGHMEDKGEALKLERECPDTLHWILAKRNFIKIKVVDSETGEPLGGAEFEIIAPQNPDVIRRLYKELDDWQSDYENGPLKTRFTTASDKLYVFSMYSLYNEQVKIRQIKAPDGYKPMPVDFGIYRYRGRVLRSVGSETDDSFLTYGIDGLQYIYLFEIKNEKIGGINTSMIGGMNKPGFATGMANVNIPQTGNVTMAGSEKAISGGVNNPPEEIIPPDAPPPGAPGYEPEAPAENVAETPAETATPETSSPAPESSGEKAKGSPQIPEAKADPADKDGGLKTEAPQKVGNTTIVIVCIAIIAGSLAGIYFVVKKRILPMK